MKSLTHCDYRFSHFQLRTSYITNSIRINVLQHDNSSGIHPTHHGATQSEMWHHPLEPPQNGLPPHIMPIIDNLL